MAMLGKTGKAMQVSVLRTVAIPALALLLGAGWADPAGAAKKEMPQDKRHVGGPVEDAGEVYERTREGYLFYPLGEAGLSTRRGSLELLVRRTAVVPSTERTYPNYYPLVEFETSKGKNLFSIYVQWDDERNPGGSTIAMGGERYLQPRELVWGLRNNFGPSPGVGGEARIVLTWGPSPEDNRIFVNGREVTSYALLQGAGESLRTGSLSSLLRDADLMRVPDNKLVGGLLPRHRDFSVDTEILEIAVHDEVLTPAAAPAIASVDHDAARVAGFSGKLVAGNTLSVTLQGTPGAAGTFDIAHFPDLSRSIPLDWRGWGVYLEDKTFYEKDEVNLRDVEGYRVYAGTSPFDPLAPGIDPVEELEVQEQSYLLENLEIDTPYYVAVVAVMRDGTLRPVIAPVVGRQLAEGEPGVYGGSWEVGYQDRYLRAAVVGRLRNGGEATMLVSRDPFAVDSALTVAVATAPSILVADEKSAAKVTVTVTDANGNAVPDHEIKFLLATTSQYTGVVGGGAFTEQVGGALKADLRGRTDLFGRVTATYVAGFAAKTAVIVARDMASNSTGAGHVQTFIKATAQLELEPVQRMMAMAAGYEIAVTSSDEWLTADGRSQARITARVTLGGEPVEGHRVSFKVASGSGRIRAVSERTGRDGEARAVFTAGTKIGLALITATDTTANVSGSVQIELRSDAPAKIAITVDPAKLPADGSSRAGLTVLVTDINDNPNDNVEVEYAITEGGGDLREEKGLTDRRGESENTYTAGRSPGRVSIEITVRSMVPTEEEVAKARELAVAVTDYKFF